MVQTEVYLLVNGQPLILLPTTPPTDSLKTKKEDRKNSSSFWEATVVKVKVW